MRFQISDCRFQIHFRLQISDGGFRFRITDCGTDCKLQIAVLWLRILMQSETCNLPASGSLPWGNWCRQLKSEIYNLKSAISGYSNSRFFVSGIQIQASAASRKAAPVTVNATPKPRVAASDPTVYGAAALAMRPKL
jgi:hypothetical protein